MKKKTVQIIAFLLMTVMMLTSIDFASYASEINTEEKEATEIEQEISDDNADVLDDDSLIPEDVIEYGEEIEVTEEKIYAASSMGLVIEAEYVYSSYGTTIHYYIIKNTSGRNLDITTNTVAYDKYGNVAGDADGRIFAVSQGATVLIDEVFSKVSNASAFSTTFKVKDSKYTPIITNLHLKVERISKGVVVEITNQGSVAADFVQATALFFRGGSLIGRDWTYFTDSDSQIKPWNAIRKQLDIYEGFDDVKVYICGGRGEYNYNLPNSQEEIVEPTRDLIPITPIAPDLSKGQLYRFSRPDGGDWLITCNETEILNLIRAGWNNDGRVGNISSWGQGVPVYRFSNSITNDRMFSDNDEEIKNYNAAKPYGWVNEGIAFYYNPKASIEVTRYATFEGLHIWSTDPAEQKNFDKAGWHKEGQAFRVDWIN